MGSRREDNLIVGHLKRSSSIRVKIEGQKEAASLGEKDRDRAACEDSGSHESLLFLVQVNRVGQSQEH